MMARLPILLASVCMLMYTVTVQAGSSAVNLDVSYPNGATAGGLLVVNCTFNAKQATIQTLASLTVLGSKPYGAQDEFEQLAVVDIWSQQPRLSSELEDANVVLKGEADQANPSQSYLVLSWNSPASGYRQFYKCVANGIDNEGQAASAYAKVKVELLGGGGCCEGVDSIVSEIQILSQRFDSGFAGREEFIATVQSLPAKVDTMEQTLMNLFQQGSGFQTKLFEELGTKLQQMFQQGSGFQIKLLAIDRSKFLAIDTFKGRLYAVSKQEGAFNIAQANEDCKASGGYLLEIDDEEEYKFVYDVVTRIGGSKGFFTGGNDIDQEGTFVYYNSKKPVPELKGWSGGQPDDFGGSEDCMEIRLRLEGLNDVGCSEVRKFVCEVPLV